MDGQQVRGRVEAQERRSGSRKVGLDRQEAWTRRVCHFKGTQEPDGKFGCGSSCLFRPSRKFRAQKGSLEKPAWRIDCSQRGKWFECFSLRAQNWAFCHAGFIWGRRDPWSKGLWEHVLRCSMVATRGLWPFCVCLGAACSRERRPRRTQGLGHLVVVL